MDSKNITATEGRLIGLMNTIVENAISDDVNRQIEKISRKDTIRSGVITKFYQYIDKAEVKLDNSGQLVLCKILHRFGGDIIDFYTPLSDSESYDETLHEPYVVPKAPQHVLVANINDEDSEEYLILGYYQNSEIVGYNPASPGNLKLMCLTETNQYWIKFGRGGLDYRGTTTPSMIVGDEIEDMDTFDITDNYSKSETYTRTEVDNLISNIQNTGSGSGNVNLNDYVKKSDVSVDMSLQTNGYIKIQLNIGD